MINTITKVGATILLLVGVTGVQLKPGSLAHQLARAIVGETVKTAQDVVAFAKETLEEARQESKPATSREEGSEKNPTAPQPQTMSSMAAPEVVAVMPSADGTITVKTRIDGQLINVAVDRAQVEALKAQAAANRVEIAFTLNGHRYATEIGKDALIATLVNR